MKIRILGVVSNASGVFKPGDEVELRWKDAKPLIDCGAAEPVEDPESEPEEE